MNHHPPRTPERDAEIAAALAAYEGATTLAQRITGRALCEQIANSEYRMGRECQSILNDMRRIGKDTSVMDAMDAKSPFSKANWAKAKAARASLTQAQAA